MLGGLLAAFPVAVAQPALGLAGGWSIVPSPDKGAVAIGDYLTGVSCVSARSCMAVGYYVSKASQQDQTLAESWDGVRWTVLPTPNPGPAGSSDQELLGVSCTSASACMAVGYYTDSTGKNKTLAESWNGTSWSVLPTADAGSQSFDFLNGVSCTSPRNCVAVGNQLGSHSELTLAESWNGVKWQLRPTPNPAGLSSVLFGVSCPAARACMAVGAGGKMKSPARTLAELWNGTTWSKLFTPNSDPSGGNSLAGVSCPTARACVAVGSHITTPGHEGTLAESWNGGRWSLILPGAAGRSSDSTLSGISCWSSRACIAVGSYAPSGRLSTLVLAWNGSGWTRVPSPNPPGAASTSLAGVSCSSASACTAVGAYRTHAGEYKTLVESS